MKPKIGQLKTGQLVGRWELLYQLPDSTRWMCRCTCGSKIERLLTRAILLAKETGKESRSCGCIRKESLRELMSTHGLSYVPEYRIWNALKQRCFNANDRAYKNYGGRGISVFFGWVKDFEAFYVDIGPRPTPKHTLERIKNNFGYFPGNVKWATRKEQAANRRKPVKKSSK